MKSANNPLLIILVALSLSFSFQETKAQTPTDAVMMKPGQLCLEAAYEHARWRKYWEGTNKRENGNIGTFRRHAIVPMFNLGIVKWLNVMAAFPYVITSPTAGQIEGAHGFSDFGLWLKAAPLHKELSSGTLDILATAGFSVPMSDYVPDYAYSLGMGCMEGSFKAIVQYRIKKGFYARAHAGYMVRGDCTIPRTYYYTTQGYYTDRVNIPNAMDYSGVLGYLASSGQYKAEIRAEGMHTFGGFDIRVQDMGFPSNKIAYTRLGGFFEYHPSFAKALGVKAWGGYVVAGRNTGQSAIIGSAINYTFRLWNREKKEESSTK